MLIVADSFYIMLNMISKLRLIDLHTCLLNLLMVHMCLNNYCLLRSKNLLYNLSILFGRDISYIYPHIFDMLRSMFHHNTDKDMLLDIDCLMWGRNLRDMRGIELILGM